MPKVKGDKEQDGERIAALVADKDGAWAQGYCGGLGYAVSKAAELGHADLALDLVDEGLRRFRQKFEDELRVRRIDVSKLGEEPTCRT